MGGCLNVRPVAASIRGIASANAGDEPIRLREVEARVESHRHDRRGCFGRSDTGQYAEHAVLVQPHMVIASREWKDLIQVFALHPKLKFARSVARIFSSFEHRDDDNFNLDRRRRRCALGKNGPSTKTEEEEGSNKTPVISAHKSLPPR